MQFAKQILILGKNKDVFTMRAGSRHIQQTRTINTPSGVDFQIRET